MGSMEALRIKPLDWVRRKSYTYYERWLADSPFGVYEAGRAPLVCTYWRRPDNQINPVDTVDAGKAAAQDDFERRMMLGLLAVQ